MEFSRRHLLDILGEMVDGGDLLIDSWTSKMLVRAVGHSVRGVTFWLATMSFRH